MTDVPMFDTDAYQTRPDLSARLGRRSSSSSPTTMAGGSSSAGTASHLRVGRIDWLTRATAASGPCGLTGYRAIRIEGSVVVECCRKCLAAEQHAGQAACA